MAVFEFFKNFRETPLKKKLKLPKWFVRLCGETLSNTVFLKPARGSEWKIGLRKSDGKVWLKQGWPEFAEHYSLDRGRLVFFTYNGNSEFIVSVCDNRTSISQIYCDPDLAPLDETEVDGNAKGTDYDNAIDISDTLSLPYSDEEEESQPPCFSTHKRMRTRARCEKRTAWNSSGDEDSVGSNSGIQGKFDGPAKNANAEKPNANDNALQRDGGHKLDNPRFVVSIKQSHFSDKLNIPTLFFKKYLNIKDGDVVLFGPKGGAWTVHMHSKSGGAYARFSRSCWKTFVRDNNIAVGDICIFELINRSKTAFQVTILRVAHGPKSQQSLGKFNAPTGKANAERPGAGRGKKSKVRKRTQSPNSNVNFNALTRDGGHKSGNPSFMVSIRQSHLTYRLNIPTEFLTKYLNLKHEDVVLYGPNGGAWTVHMHIVNNGEVKARFSRSCWRKFAQDNSLAIGDICIFELINRSKTAFNVNVLCVVDDPKGQPSLGESRKFNTEDLAAAGNCIGKCKFNLKHRRAYCAAAMFSSRNPFFQAVVPKKFNHMGVLSLFASEHFEQKKQTIRLEVGKTTWPVTLIKCQSRFFFGGGFATFVRANSLRPGDVCIYELIKKNPVKLKVTIFPYDMV